MQTLRNEGLGFDRIADSLNRDGIQPRRADTRWHSVGEPNPEPMIVWAEPQLTRRAILSPLNGCTSASRNF